MHRVRKDGREIIRTMESNKKVKGDCLIVRSWDVALSDDDIKQANVEIKTLESISKYIDSLTNGTSQQESSLVPDSNPLEYNFDVESVDNSHSIQSTDVDPTMLTALSAYIDDIAIDRGDDRKTNILNDDNDKDGSIDRGLSESPNNVSIQEKCIDPKVLSSIGAFIDALSMKSPQSNGDGIESHLDLRNEMIEVGDEVKSMPADSLPEDSLRRETLEAIGNYIDALNSNSSTSPPIQCLVDENDVPKDNNVFSVNRKMFIESEQKCVNNKKATSHYDEDPLITRLRSLKDSESRKGLGSNEHEGIVVGGKDGSETSGNHSAIDSDDPLILRLRKMAIDNNSAIQSANIETSLPTNTLQKKLNDIGSRMPIDPADEVPTAQRLMRLKQLFHERRSPKSNNQLDLSNLNCGSYELDNFSDHTGISATRKEAIKDYIDMISDGKEAIDPTSPNIKLLSEERDIDSVITSITKKALIVADEDSVVSEVLSEIVMTSTNRTDLIVVRPHGEYYLDSSDRRALVIEKLTNNFNGASSKYQADRSAQLKESSVEQEDSFEGDDAYFLVDNDSYNSFNAGFLHSWERRPLTPIADAISEDSGTDRLSTIPDVTDEESISKTISQDRTLSATSTTSLGDVSPSNTCRETTTNQEFEFENGLRVVHLASDVVRTTHLESIQKKHRNTYSHYEDRQQMLSSSEVDQSLQREGINQSNSTFTNDVKESTIRFENLSTPKSFTSNIDLNGTDIESVDNIMSAGSSNYNAPGNLVVSEGHNEFLSGQNIGLIRKTFLNSPISHIDNNSNDSIVQSYSSNDADGEESRLEQNLEFHRDMKESEEMKAENRLTSVNFFDDAIDRLFPLLARSYNVLNEIIRAFGKLARFSFPFLQTRKPGSYVTALVLSEGQKLKLPLQSVNRFLEVSRLFALGPDWETYLADGMDYTDEKRILNFVNGLIKVTLAHYGPVISGSSYEGLSGNEGVEIVISEGVLENDDSRGNNERPTGTQSKDENVTTNFGDVESNASRVAADDIHAYWKQRREQHVDTVRYRARKLRVLSSYSESFRNGESRSLLSASTTGDRTSMGSYSQSGDSDDNNPHIRNNIRNNGKNRGMGNNNVNNSRNSSSLLDKVGFNIIRQGRKGSALSHLALPQVWKQSYADRTKSHNGYYDVDVNSMYDSCQVLRNENNIDGKPWELRVVKQRFLHEQSLTFARNWFGELKEINGNLNIQYRTPCQIKSMDIPMSAKPWTKDWYQKDWAQSLPSNISESICSEVPSKEVNISQHYSTLPGPYSHPIPVDSRCLQKLDRNDDDNDDDNSWEETPECGKLKVTFVKPGERITRVTPELTSFLRRSRWRKKHFPKGTCPYK